MQLGNPDLKTCWKAAFRRAGMRYIRFHYLRHTFNTRLIKLSVPREVRMALLGHTFGDIHERYEHLELPLKRKAISFSRFEKLDVVFLAFIYFAFIIEALR